MLNRNHVTLDKLVSLNNNVSYVITLNLVGEVISQYYRDTDLSNKNTDKITKGFTRILTATSLLNFDNVKFLMYEEDKLKNVIINFEEISVVIGLINSSLSDVLDMIGKFVSVKSHY